MTVKAPKRQRKKIPQIPTKNSKPLLGFCFSLDIRLKNTFVGAIIFSIGQNMNENDFAIENKIVCNRCRKNFGSNPVVVASLSL